MANGNGFPTGTCPDSDHISSERARLKQASVKHFAQTASGKAQAAPPKQTQATGGPAPSGFPPIKAAKGPPPSGPMDLDDGM